MSYDSECWRGLKLPQQCSVLAVAYQASLVSNHVKMPNVAGGGWTQVSTVGDVIEDIDDVIEETNRTWLDKG